MLKTRRIEEKIKIKMLSNYNKNNKHSYKKNEKNLKLEKDNKIKLNFKTQKVKKLERKHQNKSNNIETWMKRNNKRVEENFWWYVKLNGERREK